MVLAEHDGKTKAELRKRLLDGIKWVDENTLEGELTDEEVETRFMAAMKVRNEYEVCGDSYGRIMRHSCPLSYRGVHFLLIISQGFSPKDDEEEIELGDRKDEEISCDLGKDVNGFYLLCHECLGGRGFMEDRIFQPEYDGSLKERTEKRLMKAADEIDWLLDECENDIRKHCEDLIETLRDVMEEIEDE